MSNELNGWIAESAEYTEGSDAYYTRQFKCHYNATTQAREVADWERGYWETRANQLAQQARTRKLAKDAG
jgi:hypothetical protein